MSKTSQSTPVEWNNLNWRKLERAVFKLQNRILRAAQRGDEKAVRKLQKTLARSWSAKCLVARQRSLSEIKSNPDKARSSSSCDVKCRQNKRQGIDNAAGVKKGDRRLNSAEQIRTCTQSLSFLLKANKTANLEDLTPKINKIIQDWSNQNRHQCNRKLLKRIHHDLHQIIMQWGHRRTRSYQRAYHLYWQQLNGRVQLGKQPD